MSDLAGMPNPSFSQPVGSVPSKAHNCKWCHKQYASKAKLLQHNRSKHQTLLQSDQQVNFQLSQLIIYNKFKLGIFG